MDLNWKPIVGAIGGAIVTGVTTAIANQIAANARSEAAATLNQTNEERSGKKSFDRAAQAGIAEGIDQQNLAGNLAASISQGGSSRIGNAMNAIDNSNQSNQFNSGFNAEFGRNRENDQNAMNRTRTEMNNKISQADTNAGVARQAGQSILDTASGGLNLYNQLRNSNQNESSNGSPLVPAMPQQGVGV